MSDRFSMPAGSLLTRLWPDTVAPQLGGQRLDWRTGREPGLSRTHAPVIVHVDDDPATRELVALVLEVNGYHSLRGFYDGREAFDYCVATRPDLLITDVARPGMDGITLCRLIRETPGVAHMPVIIHSAYFCLEVVRAAEALDALYLAKPCTIGELMAGILTALGRA